MSVAESERRAQTLRYIHDMVKEMAGLARGVGDEELARKLAEIASGSSPRDRGRLELRQ